MFLIKLSLSSMPTYFLRLFPFPRYKGVKIGTTPKILNFYFKFDFYSFFSPLDLLGTFISTKFDLALVVTKIKGGKRS